MKAVEEAARELRENKPFILDALKTRSAANDIKARGILESFMETRENPCKPLPGNVRDFSPEWPALDADLIRTKIE